MSGIIYRAVIVDDEPLARTRIRRFLSEEPDMEVVGECADGAQAVDLIRELAPEVVFLDVQMPKMDGIEVIRQIGAHNLRTVVFVTAFNHYAVQAFEAEAVDYLLKPFDRRRFQEALQRIRRRLTEYSHETLSEQIEQLVKRFQPSSPYLQRLVIRSEGSILLVRVEDVDWLEAAGNYVCVHLGKRNHIVRDSLAHLEKQLDPARFLRVHRSTMVNLDRIRELRPTFQGDYKVVLLSGDILPLGRKYREALTRQLGIAL